MEEPSRTEQKRQAHSLQKLGESLVELPKSKLNQMDISDRLKEAVLLAKSLKKHGAKRRQMQLIGAIMRDVDAEPIIRFLDRIKAGGSLAPKESAEIQDWQEQILKAAVESGSDPALTQSFIEQYPGTDRGRLSQLIRNVAKEVKQGKHTKSSKSSRALFKYIKEVIDDGQNHLLEDEVI